MGELNFKPIFEQLTPSLTVITISTRAGGADFFKEATCEKESCGQEAVLSISSSSLATIILCGDKKYEITLVSLLSYSYNDHDRQYDLISSCHQHFLTANI